LPVHAEIAAAVLDQLVDFLEGSLIEEEFDALANGEFTFAVLAFAAFGSTTLFGGGMSAAEFF
jgi:hypothetical protein